MLRKPGYELQRLLGTREPSEPQLEVGRAALAEILRVEPSYRSRRFALDERRTAVPRRCCR